MDTEETKECKNVLIKLGGFLFWKTDRPLIMGVLNVTPDSFYDGGNYSQSKSAINRASKMVEEGVDIIDLGGESSRPGSNPVALEVESVRVIPVLKEIRKFGVPISVDTTKSELMLQAIDEGASMINDISGFREVSTLQRLAHYEVGICVMHMQNTPSNMQNSPTYKNVVSEVRDFLKLRVGTALRAGFKRDQIIIDPGFGFGKTHQDNLKMHRNLESFVALRYPVLVGLSRKSFIGQMTGRDVKERRVGSVVAGVLAAQRGAAILRVHDVASTRDALKVFHELQN